jgi:LmbE family N-acetylglucosaminyl deacetylase
MKKPAFLDRLCMYTATKFLTRIHRITHRMPIKLKKISKQKVLLIAPHTDDEVVAVGGCLSLHQNVGSEVMVAYVTSNSNAPQESISYKRMLEAKKVAEYLGFDYKFLEYPDGKVSLHEKELGQDITDLINKFRPEAFYCPFPSDHHRDHQAVSSACNIALNNLSFKFEICAYEIWSTMWPNYAVDISRVIEQKRKAINLYESQVEHVPYADAACGLNRYRGLRVYVPYAEGLYICSIKEYINISETLSFFF